MSFEIISILLAVVNLDTRCAHTSVGQVEQGYTSITDFMENLVIDKCFQILQNG